ncbi:MAG: RNA-binding S4 domain-containing protein [Eubacteriales bacterium]|nr:RNA-binding S4 domain-containing protein [Bacillota bacterium]MBV1727948.1 RNA-binding S4 domain-containing protein [Desulforudis sp.]MDP3051868.1 RNA-binding S4 domain-containing protein [Eubacteriales bacterium]MDQ7789116.1 RNA-binding S4 domain-containing protein [Clostridia bacterium]MBU4554923.1 RNA-binding S4 domain-containing protein [Bacillota bacterium]
MRLDKFLKVSRIVKRRTLAKEVCERGLVVVNDRPAKAGTTVKPGDMVSVMFGSRRVEFEVLKLADNVPAKEARELYRLIGGNESLD